MLLLCSPTELCACAVTGLAIQTPSGTGQTDLTAGHWQGQHHQMSVLSLPSICKTCRTKLWVCSLVTRGSRYPHHWAAKASLLPSPAGPLATIAAKGQPEKIAQPGLDLYFPLLSQKTPPFFQHSCFPSLLRKHALFLIPGLAL